MLSFNFVGSAAEAQSSFEPLEFSGEFAQTFGGLFLDRSGVRLLHNHWLLPHGSEQDLRVNFRGDTFGNQHPRSAKLQSNPAFRSLPLMPLTLVLSANLGRPCIGITSRCSLAIGIEEFPRIVLCVPNSHLGQKNITVGSFIDLIAITSPTCSCSFRFRWRV